MFQDPLGIVAVLLGIEAGVLLLSQWHRTAGFFKYLPSMFWIYFLPMLANTFGVVPGRSDVYDILGTYCLPASLVLLLISVDLRAILRLGPVALAVMLAGSAGILAGGPVVMLLFGPWLPADAWTGIGALSGSWIGGSANMAAVAASIGTPEHIFGAMVVVDTICPYAWMGLLIFLSSYQRPFDRWNRSNAAVIDELTARAAATEAKSHPLTLAHVAAMFALAGAAVLASQRGAERLADWTASLDGKSWTVLLAWTKTFNVKAWMILLASALGLALSFTPVRRLEHYGASKVGYALLYLFLACLGARTSVTHLGAAPILLAAGAVWIIIHAAFLLAAGRLLRAPMALLAAASQANIGGPASAPVVAGVYLPALAPVGLLLAVLGNIIGTYLGIACSFLCRAVSGG